MCRIVPIAAPPYRRRNLLERVRAAVVTNVCQKFFQPSHPLSPPAITRAFSRLVAADSPCYNKLRPIRQILIRNIFDLNAKRASLVLFAYFFDNLLCSFDAPIIRNYLKRNFSRSTDELPYLYTFHLLTPSQADFSFSSWLFTFSQLLVLTSPSESIRDIISTKGCA